MNEIKKDVSLSQTNSTDERKNINETKKSHNNYVESNKNSNHSKRVETLICDGDGLGIQGKIEC